MVANDGNEHDSVYFRYFSLSRTRAIIISLGFVNRKLLWFSLSVLPFQRKTQFFSVLNFVSIECRRAPLLIAA